MIGGILAALQYAPAVFSAGREVFGAVTGEKPAETPEQLAEQIDSLAPEQRQQITEQIIAAKVQRQTLDTQRFSALTEGSADRIKSTARPEIALRAMGMMELFSRCFYLLIIATLIQWFANWFLQIFEIDHQLPSVWASMAAAEPVAEMIWAPLLASFYAAIEVIKKYMGCRERDKAQEYESAAGRPLQSSSAVVEAAGGAIAGMVRAFRK
jgi:hypothetical protein